jgi:DNA-binding NtrC family response regulator
MQRMYRLGEKLAGTDLPVVIEGESGTGKELLAESLHDLGARAGGPFVVFDCAGTPPALVESALFGHQRGAFTGANADRVGAFATAHGGTLFLDEIGELPVEIQPKLLRALARGEVQRVGSNAWTAFDVRVIAATRRDLDREVQEGRFREDLFYRLAVGRIELPPLRQRVGDVALLARHFWRDSARTDEPLPRDVIARLEAWHWPGNVRELENAIARYAALGDVDLAHGIDVAPSSSGNPFEAILDEELPLVRAREKIVQAFEEQYIARVLDKHGGNVSRAAASSGLARRYFQILHAKRRPRK